MHFYAKTENGVEPRHFVPMAKDPSRTRPTRMTDVRAWWKEGLQVCPSVTTVMGILDKPALVNWKVDKHLDAAFRLKDRPALLDDWKLQVKSATSEAMDVAPKAGTDFHKLMEDYFEGALAEGSDDFRLCHHVAGEIFSKAGGNHSYEVETEVNFISDMGFAGQADLVIHGSKWIIDYKSKESADKFKPGKMAYDEHRMQLAAYRNGLGVPEARCANAFVCLETGEVDFHPHTEDELARGFDIFKHCLAIWQLKNDCKDQFNGEYEHG